MLGTGLAEKADFIFSQWDGLIIFSAFSVISVPHAYRVLVWALDEGPESIKTSFEFAKRSVINSFARKMSDMDNALHSWLDDVFQGVSSEQYKLIDQVTEQSVKHAMEKYLKRLLDEPQMFIVACPVEPTFIEELEHRVGHQFKVRAINEPFDD